VSLRQADFRSELFERGLKGVVSVLEDNGISTLSIFAKLEEEDFSAMSLKPGHWREMLHWWRSLNQAGFCRAERRNSNVKTEMKYVTIRSHYSYPSPAATHADWGAEIFNKCIQPYSWSELRSGYKSMKSSMSFKTGGLGKLLEQDGMKRGCVSLTIIAQSRGWPKIQQTRGFVCIPRNNTDI